MADRKFSMDDYIDVAERIQNFRTEFPDGSLQQYVPWETREVAGQTFIVYTAAAYRTPDDHRPGIGTAWEPFPGTTPYTRNSELMNAETAAWGRAIVALGLTANRKIASRQEVQARAGETSPDLTRRASGDTRPSDAQMKELGRQVKLNKPGVKILRAMLDQIGGQDITAAEIAAGSWSQRVSKAQVSGLIGIFKNGALPTGESDIPSDLDPVPEHGDDGSPLPFDEREPETAGA